MPSRGATRRRGTNDAEGLERVGRVELVDREVRRVVDDADRPVLDPGPAVPDLEEPPRPDAEERVAAEPLSALDGFEEVGRGRPVVEAQERADGRLEVGRARGAQEDGVGRRRVALGLGQAERVRAAVHRRHRLCCRPGRYGPGIKNDLRPPGTKGRAFRGATLIRRLPHSLTDGRPSRAADRRCPLSLALCAGAYLGFVACLPRRARRSVRRLPGPFPAVVAPVSTSHRISLPTPDGYSSRSQPLFS